MNKTAIKNFAIWARNKLIADSRYQLRLLGIDENGIKEKLEQVRLELSANEVRRQTVAEQFEELGADPAAVITTLPEEAEEKTARRARRRKADQADRTVRLGRTALHVRQGHGDATQQPQHRHHPPQEGARTHVPGMDHPTVVQIRR